MTALPPSCPQTKRPACDATVETDVARLLDAVVAAHGPLDSAVLVAGEGVIGNIDDMPQAEFERCMQLNFYAPVYFLRHAARRLRDGGSIVLMTSIAATNRRGQSQVG